MEHVFDFAVKQLASLNVSLAVENPEAGLPLALFGGVCLLSKLVSIGRPHRSSDAVTHAVLEPPLREGERLLVVGDVHGCLEELEMIVSKARDELPADAAMQMRVVLVGDLVNKGPYSAEVVKHARRQQWQCVMGNHDLAAIKQFHNVAHDAEPQAQAQAQAQGGRYAWLSKLSPHDRQWLLDLPYTLSIPQLNAVVVHAGLVPLRPLQEQNQDDMVLMRNVSRIPAAEASLQGAHYIAHTHAGEGQPWAETYGQLLPIKCQYHSLPGQDSKPHVYFGHDAKRGLQRYSKATGLDTGCCYGRLLTAVLLPEGKIVQVHSLAVYQQPTGGGAAPAEPSSPAHDAHHNRMRTQRDTRSSLARSPPLSPAGREERRREGKEVVFSKSLTSKIYRVKSPLNSPMRFNA